MGDVERLRIGMRLMSSAVSGFADATSDYQRLLDTVARSLAWVVGDACALLMLQPDGSLVAKATHAIDPVVGTRLADILAAPLHPGDRSVSWEVLRTARAQFLTAADLEAAQQTMPASKNAFLANIGATGLIIVAMRVRGTSLGVLAIVRHRAERPPLDELDLELAQDLASHAALAIANAQLVEALRESEELRRAEQEAVRANRFLDAVIEHIPDMVFVKDADHLAFTRFNRAGEELLGMSRAELIGKTDHDFFPPEEAAFFQAKDRETLANKRMVEIAEEPIQTRNGERWLYTKKVPILDEDGTPRYLLGISQDITERKHAHAQLLAAKERAEEASRELEAFSYSVAHDLRAPLRGIDGFSQALLDDYGDHLDEEGRRHLIRVRTAAQRMAALIDDLLALSRVTRAELTRERVDLSALAHASLTRLQRSDPDRRVDVVTAPELIVEGDPRLLAVALDNLFDNAWKFTGKVAVPRIELGATIEDGCRTYFIRDNGAGFDAQYVDKLFGVFQRLHTETEFPGTGIGLATVARIIHRHRGRVRAESAVGEGATFYFTLGETEAA